MPTKKITIDESDTRIPETLIGAMYKYIKKNPKYIMPIHDIYALYDIATLQFERNMKNVVREMKKQSKTKK